MNIDISEYYVVGVYNTIDEVPDRKYKITRTLEEALPIYINHYMNERCAVGHYYNNKLIELIQLKNTPADGPGIFKKSTKEITEEDIKNYSVD